MRVIMGGSRGAGSPQMMGDIIHDAGFPVTEVVSGACHTSPDRYGELWAQVRGVPVKQFPANWAAYGRSAGPIRNAAMAEYADAYVGIWDGRSPGTENMMREMERRGKPYYIRVTSGLGGVKVFRVKERNHAAAGYEGPAAKEAE